MYESVLENQDPVLYFKDSITSLETTNKESYDKIVASLTADKIEIMKQCFAKAEEQSLWNKN